MNTTGEIDCVSVPGPPPPWARWIVLTSEGRFIAWAKNSKEVCSIVDAGTDRHWAKVNRKTS